MKSVATALAGSAALMLVACQAAPLPDADPRGAAGADVPLPALVGIGQVQGRGARSALVDRQVSVQGVVVGNFAKGLQGVFVQSERDDGDPLTAEGIFVAHDGKAQPLLRTGDRVRVSGRVVELGDGLATLTGLADSVVEVIGRGEVRTTDIARAPESAAAWERLEGMALRITAPLTVSGVDGLTRYGEIAVSFDGRLYQSTEQAAPGPQALALEADNARRSLLLDDNRTSKDPDNLWFLPRGLDDAHPLRAGSVLHQVRGVLDQRRGQYRLQLSDKFDARQAPRPTPPEVPGDLRIASFNLHNLFNGDGAGGGFPTARGAETVEHYRRQQQKLVASVQALAPDIAALMEVENDGAGPDSALAQFVAALNAAGPIRDYRAVDAGGATGTDQIRVALIYRGGRVSAQGVAASLLTGPFDGFSRAPLAQAFRAGSGPVFVVSANHFKSKGCGSEAARAQGAEADQRDGQSCWNPTRVRSAQELLAWLGSDPTRSGARLNMVIGDLNAHAQEDPLRTFRDAGWRDAIAPAPAGQQHYSFVFNGRAGSLDHALLDAGLAARLRGAAIWHNNADESEFFDYRQDAQGDPFRASDHDPLLLGLDLRGPGL